MPTTNLGSKYIGNDGTKDTDVVIVGEAPGKNEVIEELPFVGRSGELLTRYLERAGLRRTKVFLTNLCHYQPKGNKFRHCLGTEELEAGIAELKENLEEIQPKIIIALGAWPLYYLTGMTSDAGKPGSGISQWRGSIIDCTLVEGLKVLPTFHPSYILRMWSQNPIFAHDLGKAANYAKNPTEMKPWTFEIDPPLDQLRALVDRIISENLPVAVDIETFTNNTFSCIGFAYSDTEAFTVTYLKPELHSEIQRLWESDVPKIFQFGTFDITFMYQHYGWVCGGYYDGGFDTYIAAANLQPTFKKGLDFLTSIYTDIPYYKVERKTWRESGNMDQLWEYNIKDVIATYRIYLAQQAELRDLAMKEIV